MAIEFVSAARKGRRTSTAIEASLMLILGMLLPTGVVALAAGEEPPPPTDSASATPGTESSTPASEQPSASEPSTTTGSPQTPSSEGSAPPPADPGSTGPDSTSPSPDASTTTDPAATEPNGRMMPMDVTGPYSITRDGITYTISLQSDSTGHGTPQQCAINQTMGYTPGDNTATDGTMCTTGLATYRVDVGVAAPPHPGRSTSGSTSSRPSTRPSTCRSRRSSAPAPRPSRPPPTRR